MKKWPLLLLVFLLTACSTTYANEAEQSAITITPSNIVTGQPSDLPNLGEAPELTNEVWINTSEPLRLANLKGQVVLLEMWTFG